MGAVSVTEEDRPTIQKVGMSFLVIFLIYLLITAVGMIGAGFKGATKGDAAALFEFATNPFMGLIIGILATSLVQSSSTVTSIIVGLVAGGLGVEAAIPMVMGANIGTTITNTIVALGSVHKKKTFRRAFAAATVHDFFNLIAVVLFLPLEIFFGVFEKIGGFFATYFVGADASVKEFNFVKLMTKPGINIGQDISTFIYAEGANILMIILGVMLIFASITFMGKLLKLLMVGRAKEVMHKAIGRGPISSIFSGTVVTIAVQSSSTTTSLMVPMAASGIFRLKQIYPFTLGANIGTCITSLLAATAITGATALPALQIALVHLAYNTLAVLLIYGWSTLRYIPLRGASSLAKIATEKKSLAILYVLGVYFGVPLLMIMLSKLF